MPLPEKLQQQLVDYHLGAHVYSSDDHNIGNLERLLVKKDLWELAAIVIKETRNFAHLIFHTGTALLESDVIVPLSAIASKAHDRVDLNISAQKVRTLRPYLDFGPPGPLPPGYENEQVLSSIMGGLALYPLTEYEHKDKQDIEVSRGENVMLGHEGNLFGKLDDVLTDQGELAGIVVKPSGFFKHNVVVPIRFLERSDDAALFINLTLEQMEQLQRFVPENG